MYRVCCYFYGSKLRLFYAGWRPKTRGQSPESFAGFAKYITFDPMSIHYPKPLVPGDLIAITAPSAGVPAPLHRRLDRAIDTLRQRGYRVVEGECLRQQNKQFNTRTPRCRTDEVPFRP
jgi:hypothetical protein